jgi:hypothetical protein
LHLKGGTAREWRPKEILSIPPRPRSENHCRNKAFVSFIKTCFIANSMSITVKKASAKAIQTTNDKFAICLPDITAMPSAVKWFY